MHNLNQKIEKSITLESISDCYDHRMGTLIQPLTKPMAKMINGVDMPNMIIYGKGVFIGFSPSLSPADCQYLHIANTSSNQHIYGLITYVGS